MAVLRPTGRRCDIGVPELVTGSSFRSTAGGLARVTVSGGVLRLLRPRHLDAVVELGLVLQHQPDVVELELPVLPLVCHEFPVEDILHTLAASPCVLSPLVDLLKGVDVFSHPVPALAELLLVPHIRPRRLELVVLGLNSSDVICVLFLWTTDNLIQVAFWYGLVVHLRIYPIIYALPIIILLDLLCFQHGKKPALVQWSFRTSESSLDSSNAEITGFWNFFKSIITRRRGRVWDSV